MNVKVRLSGGTHWHLLDCPMAQSKDYVSFPILDILNGHIFPDSSLDGSGKTGYILCPGCSLRIKEIILVVKK